jgi:hypothetical protein
MGKVGMGFIYNVFSNDKKLQLFFYASLVIGLKKLPYYGVFSYKQTITFYEVIEGFDRNKMV